MIVLRWVVQFGMAAKRDLLKRIDNRTKMTLRQMQIDRGFFQAGMPQEKLNGSQVGSRFAKVCLSVCGPMVLVKPARFAAPRTACQTVLSDIGFSTPRRPAVLGNR